MNARYKRLKNRVQKIQKRSAAQLQAVTRELQQLPSGIVVTDTLGVSGGVTDIDFNNEKTGINAADPENPTDLTNKRYVDSRVPAYNDTRTLVSDGSTDVQILPNYNNSIANGGQEYAFFLTTNFLISFTNNRAASTLINYKIIEARINNGSKMGSGLAVASGFTVNAGSTIYFTDDSTNSAEQLEYYALIYPGDFIRIVGSVSATSVGAGAFFINLYRHEADILTLQAYTGVA